MATYIPYHAVNRQFHLAGVPDNGGTLYFYLADTTTAAEVFSDITGTSAGTSVTLDSNGMPSASGVPITIYRDQAVAMKFKWETSGGATVITPPNDPAVASYDSTASTKLDGIEEGADVTDTAGVSSAGALMKTGGTMTGDIALADGVFPKWSVIDSIVAATTQTQAAATQLTAAVNRLSEVANTNDGAKLPTAVAGRFCLVYNNGANTAKIWPNSSDDIDGTGVDTAITLAASTSTLLYCYDTTNWITLV